MGRSGNTLMGGTYMAYFNLGHNFSIQRNKFINVGYMPIQFRGGFGLVKYNYVDSFCFIKADGGGIYTWQAAFSGNFDSGSVVRKNIVRRGCFRLAGEAGSSPVTGVYLDERTRGVIVDSNTIESTRHYGVYFKGFYNKITNNTIYVKGEYDYGLLNNDSNSSDTMTGNIIYTTNNYGYALRLTRTYDTTERIDFNHYIMPSDSSHLILTGSTIYSLSEFKAAYPRYDRNSTASLPSVAYSYTPLFIYNATLSNATTALGGNYVDAKGQYYFSEVTVEPFGSRLLFPATLPTPGYKIRGFKFR